MYRLWYRRYLLDRFIRYFGNFSSINLREQKRKIFRDFPRKASSKGIAKPRCCKSVVGNHRAAAPVGYPTHPQLQITKLKKKFPNARAGQTVGHMHIFFLLFTNFQWKNSRSFFIFAHQCFVGAIWTHTFQKGAIV